jgi:hypothetical protein
MGKFKTYLFALILILFSMPYSVAMAQDAFSTNSLSTESVQVDDNTTKEKKKDKKKKEDKDYVKDEVEVNQTFFISLLINLVTVFIIVRLIYYPNYHKQDVFFTYFLFNIAIFLLTFLLNKIKISMGAAFGLFAVFSMLRYRTEGISMKDMTYLFIVIAVGLISAVQLDFLDLAIINSILIVFTFLLDGNLLMRREYSKLVNYEKIELIQPEKQEELIADLKARTGLNVHHVSIVKIDFLRDMAVLNIYYYVDKKSKLEGKQDYVDYRENLIE